MEYNQNCGLSKEEWQLEKIVDHIKAEPSTLLCIGILRQALSIYDVVWRSEQLKAFREWYDNLTQEEYAWYEGRYEEVFLSL